MQGRVGENVLVISSVEPTKEAKAVVDGDIDDSVTAIGLRTSEKAGWVVDLFILVAW